MPRLATGRLRFGSVVLFCWLCVLLAERPLAAQSKKKKTAEETPAGPTDFRSQNFLIHTDLSPAEAQDLLDRLETMLALVEDYFAHKLTGIIECYVVKDLDRWPNGLIPDEGLPHIRAGAGVTLTTALTNGAATLARSVVYAVADRGTPQHEAMHAYCGQTFGTTGPVWYSEGIAEMGQYWRKGDTSVHIHDGVLEYLRSHADEPKTLDEIVNAKEFTGDSWQNYAWRWALCHLLSANLNYRDKFRPLGLALLKKHPTSFEQVYGDMASEIIFEYRFFIRHLEQGYRVDLCSWDWKRKFRAPKGSATITAKITADHGWQPSGVILSENTSYRYKATGTWKLSDDGPDLSADGGDDGAGRLLGVVLAKHDQGEIAEYSLGEPFELGAEGTFTAPADGQLFLRCRSPWGEIADNRGSVTVKLKAEARKAGGRSKESGVRSKE